jgi:hypothetical protein
MLWLAAAIALLAQDATTSSPDLTLHYPSAQVSQQVARDMLDALDEEFARIRHELGCVIGQKVTTVVIPLDTWQQMGHSPWAGAMFDGRILVPLVYERSRVGSQMRRVFAHEMVHACISRFGNFPTWLHEGLAQYLSGDRLSEDIRRQYRQALAQGKLPGLERLAGGWLSLSGDQANTAYAYSLWAVEVLLANEGSEAVRQLLRNPSRIPQVTERIHDLLKR